MDLPFANVLCVQTSAQRSVGPLYAPAFCLWRSSQKRVGAAHWQSLGRYSSYLMVLFAMSLQDGATAGEATASHCEMFAQHGRT